MEITPSEAALIIQALEVYRGLLELDLEQLRTYDGAEQAVSDVEDRISRVDALSKDLYGWAP